MSPADQWVMEIDALGSLPAVFQQINEALDDPFASLERFEGIIRNDVDLTARLLRIANSSFYGFAGEVETISEAVSLVGVESLRALMSGTLVIEFFKGISPAWVDLESFWKHGLACGIAARVLSFYRRDSDPERLFVSGLLHDLGRLVLYIKAPERMPEVFGRYGRGRRRLVEVEAEVLGTRHTEVGAALLERWQFPPAICNAARFHHEPTEEHVSRMDTAIVHVADVVALAMELGHSGEKYPPPLDPEAWACLGLSERVLGPLLGEVEQQFGDALWVFFNDAVESTVRC